MSNSAGNHIDKFRLRQVKLFSHTGLRLILYLLTLVTHVGFHIDHTSISTEDEAAVIRSARLYEKTLLFQGTLYLIRFKNGKNLASTHYLSAVYHTQQQKDTSVYPDQ